jgi:hypothetical protein
MARAWANTARGADNPRGKDAFSVAETFFRGKLSPTASFAVDFSKGKTMMGDKFQLLPSVGVPVNDYKPRGGGGGAGLPGLPSLPGLPTLPKLP